MTPKLWFLAAVGSVLSLGFFAMIIWDINRMITGRTTVSRILHEVAKRHPMVPFFLGLGVGLVVGLCVAHTWWPIASVP